MSTAFQIHTADNVATLLGDAEDRVSLRGEAGQGIRDTFKETGAPLEELTSAYYDLLSAGVKVGEVTGLELDGDTVRR